MLKTRDAATTDLAVPVRLEATILSGDRIAKLITTVLAFVALARAQTSRGTVSGTVLDASGAAVAGAHLILTGEETGVRLPTESNATGVYRFNAVDLGVYDLEV